MKPKSGDIGICIKCGGVHIYNDNLTMRKPTEQDILEMNLVEISKAQKLLRMLDQ